MYKDSLNNEYKTYTHHHSKTLVKYRKYFAWSKLFWCVLISTYVLIQGFFMSYPSFTNFVKGSCIASMISYQTHHSVYI